MLEDIANGRKDIAVDMNKIAELVDGDSAEDIAQEIYEAELASQGSFKLYVAVEKPEFVTDQWVIKKFLNQRGDEAFQALKAGILWHITEARADYDETKAYYRAMMEKGQIEMRFVDLLIETKTDELKDLRSELVYFKLRGQKKGEIIYGMTDAA